jgi:tetratricopeptide (TPR) repeat protein
MQTIFLKRRYVRKLCLIFVCILLTSTLYPIYNPVSEYEISLLPEYLQAKVKYYLGMRTQNVLEAVDKYNKFLGKSVYSPLHHFGLGLIYIRRAQANSSYPKRSFDIDSSINEFSFVINHSPRDSFVLFEVYFKRGESYMLKNDITKAMKDFLDTIALKPDYFNAYFMASECYKRIGDIKNAETMLELGRSRSRK